jgi:hypothetical protein
MDTVSNSLAPISYEDFRKDTYNHSVVASIALGVLGGLAMTFSGMEYFYPVAASMPSISMLLCGAIGVYSVITAIYFAIQTHRMGRRYTEIVTDSVE